MTTRTRVILGFLLATICIWLYYSFFNSLNKEKTVNYRNVLNMAVNGDEFWLAGDQDQGFLTPPTDNGTNSFSADIHKNQQTCRNFFVIWPGDCIKSYDYLDERMRTLSAQMTVMNSTLTFFTTDTKGCSWEKYAGVRVRLFNATEELLAHGFSEVLPIMDKWDKTKFTRPSDILRLCLAYRHQMSYLDTDVHFLQLQKVWYERTYVGAQLWSDKKNAIEITNAAFCLPRNILKDMMSFQKSAIMKKERTGEKYFYTELGPSMFHHVSAEIDY
jgi:hypothetical protein